MSPIILSAARRSLQFQPLLASRLFSSTTSAGSPDPNPKANQPPSRLPGQDTPNTDAQSDISAKSGIEDKAGDDHPAKQPDPQAEPTRKTGFGGKTAVKGGKEGLE
ncbi:hypothetical protein K490DRAFT_51067 [Saccharata proteae CBS 121410]|uniref:Uncharacterized protein n=1 Tax=Saccharata proteae CBS 121410 TaxID=1314787 RepID=A0A9P4LRL8_9PEZI|nr:hypothetical protein K490DRAFT_51067 [Saccharata proteae CBS 121410]